MNIIPEKTPTGLSDAELLKIRTEVQAETARGTLERARVSLAEPTSHENRPERLGSLQYFTEALADELERTLEREQEWIRAAGQLTGAQREVLAHALGDAIAWSTNEDFCGGCEQSPTGVCPDHQAELDQRDSYIKLARELGLEVQS
jgi:hypothetical protein